MQNVDASGTGLGAVIMQEGKPVTFGSNHLLEKVCKYRERTACNRLENTEISHMCKVIIVEIDHKPLESIFWKSLNDSPTRLQRMLLKLTKYDLDVRYVPIKLQVISDCLSRAPLSNTEPVRGHEDLIGVNLVEELGFESSMLKKFKEISSTE